MIRDINHTVVNRLRKHKVYVTKKRISVLKILYEHPGGISVHSIRELAAGSLDRVTVYRALIIFLKKGIVISIPTVSGFPHYLLTEYSIKESADSKISQQVYFFCRVCGNTEFVKQKEPLIIAGPAHAEISRCNIILEGKCRKCMEQTK